MGTGIARDMWAGYPDPMDQFSETLIKIWYQLYNGPGTASGAGAASLMPYGASQATITNVAAGPSVIFYKDAAGATLKTRTFTYTNSGVSASDVMTGWSDT